MDSTWFQWFHWFQGIPRDSKGFQGIPSDSIDSMMIPPTDSEWFYWFWVILWILNDSMDFEWFYGFYVIPLIPSDSERFQVIPLILANSTMIPPTDSEWFYWFWVILWRVRDLIFFQLGEAWEMRNKGAGADCANQHIILMRYYLGNIFLVSCHSSGILYLPNVLDM